MQNRIRKNTRADCPGCVALRRVPGASATGRGLAGNPERWGCELRLVLHVTAAKDGNLTATLDSVDQGAYGIPVTSVTLKDSKFSLVVDAVHGTYDGTVNKDASEIDGTWSQGQPLDLNFHRSATPAAAGPAQARSAD